MAYIFNKENFKNHLRRNATRNWFSRNDSNVRYQRRGDKVENSVNEWEDEYTVKVNEVLLDPEIGRTGERVGSTVGMVASGTAGMGLAACLAPFTFGGSLVAAGVAGAGVLSSAAVLDYSGRPGDVYFTLAADNSKWVANTSDFFLGSVGNIASDIRRWSNRVYEDKFKTHSYQAQPPK